MLATVIYDFSPFAEILFNLTCFSVGWFLAPRVRWGWLAALASFVAAASVHRWLFAHDESVWRDEWTDFDGPLIRGWLWQYGRIEDWMGLLSYWLVPPCVASAAVYLSRRRFRTFPIAAAICASCGYDLRGSTYSHSCPECGTPIPVELKVRHWRKAAEERNSKT